jgi:integrase
MRPLRGAIVVRSIQQVKRRHPSACARAGIAHLNFHDLRREFASRLLESGASEHDVRDFLGHANITTTSRSLQSSGRRLKRALAQMELSESRTHAGQKLATPPAAVARPQAPEAPNQQTGG